MAYKYSELEKQSVDAIETISLTAACNFLKEKFNNENEFTENLLPKLERLVNEAYGLNIESIQLEKVFDAIDLGYYKIRFDIYITTKEGQDIIIECKNPSHKKSETFSAFSQIMSYQFMFTNKEKKPIFILATSVFDFMYFEFMNYFKLDIDIILNNKDHIGFWINDFKK